MKKLLLLALLLCGISQAWAETWTDSNGMTWSFDVPSNQNVENIKPYSGVWGVGDVVIPEIVYVRFLRSDIQLGLPVKSIAESAFSGYTNLTSVTIPSSVTSIGSSAFSGCTGLTSVTIPEGVTGIGASAFRDCTGLTSVTIPEGVTSIGSYAFRGCTGLTSVTINSNAIMSKSLGTIFGNQVKEYIIGEGVTRIGYKAFYGCTGLTSVTIPSSVTSIYYDAFNGCSSLTSVTIPSSVTSIGDDAFTGCTGLTQVFINSNSIMSRDWYDWDNMSPSNIASIFGSQVQEYNIGEGVTSIGSYAFYGCSGLTSVFILSSVTSIGSYAFYGCSGLTGVSIPSSVTSIGSYAFYGCSGLTGVSIPSSVTSIGSYAFYGCSGLTKVIVPDIAAWSGIAFENQDANPLYYAKRLYSDWNTEITDLVIPSGVTSIGDYAFTGCSSLTSVTIGEGVTSIGANAFTGCSGLTHVTINSNGIMTKDYTRSNNIASIFGSQVQEYNIGEGVTSIGSYAFYGCTNLTTVTISEGVTSIGSDAFYGCTNLTTVTIPSSVTSIGDLAFGHTPFYENQSDGLLYLGCIAYKYKGTMLDDTEIVIKEGTTSIYAKAFYGCSGLTSVTIPESVTSIGDYAFYGCSGLTGVSIPSSVTSIGSYAFCGCSGLTKVIVPDIAAWSGIAFENQDANPLYYAKRLYSDENTEITDLVIPSGVTSIGDYAFTGCTGLTSVTIPESVWDIGNNAFGGCSNLTRVTINSNCIMSNNYNESSNIGKIFGSQVKEYIIGEGVIQIGARMFSGCSELTSVTIPSSVSSIGYNAFSGCTGLTKVIVPDIAAWSGIAFENQDANPLYYAKRLYSDENTERTDLVIPSGVTSIGDYAFTGCTGLLSVTIPESVTSIDYNAFSGCTGLTKVIAPDIAAWFGIAFENQDANPLYYAKRLYSDENTEITDLVIPSGVTSIGDNAFYGCEGLTSVTIPSSVTSIGANAFIGCSGLTHVTINSNSIMSRDYTSSSNIVSIFGSQVQEYIIGEGVTRISPYAFYGCTGLTTVTILEGVTYIGYYAFYGCDGLTTVTIPSSVTGIGEDAFCGSTGLTSVTINSNSVMSHGYTSVYKFLSIFGSQVQEYIIGEGVTSIGSFAFYNCKGLTSVTIPSSVTSIGNSAFYGCTGLTTVTIPEGVTSIGWTAFSGCTGLTSVTIPEGVKSIFDHTFYGCTGLTSVTIPEGVKSIGEKAFYGCTGLTSVNIPEGVTSIGGRAFSDCTGLTTVYCYVPTPLAIESSTFSNCASATLYVPYGKGSAYQNASYWKNFKEIIEIEPDSYDNLYFDVAGSTAIIIGSSQPTGDLVIPSVVYKNGTAYPVTSISASAFNGCTGLSSITIPQSVTGIDASAFTGCTNLSVVRVVVTDFSSFCTNTLLGLIKSAINKPVTLIDGSGNEITEYVIPSDVSTIGASAFVNCTGLTSVTIPEGVASIDASAFTGCTNLSVVRVVVTDFSSFCTNTLLGLIKSAINKPVTLIDGSGNEITEYVIPSDVSTIGASAFVNCTGLTSVIIPSSVTSIDINAFKCCDNIHDIYCYAVSCPSVSGHYFFSSFSSYSSTLHVPEASLQQYKNHSVWGKFYKIVPIDESTAIDDIDREDSASEIEAIYDQNGQRQPALHRGINIVKMNDGTIKKVLVK